MQILALLGSLSGISWPSKIQDALSISKLANLDLVLSTAPFSGHGSVGVPRPILRASRQGLLRSDCNLHARTKYYTYNFIMFTLPPMIVVYMFGVRGLLWGLRPALLFLRPQLKGDAFFDSPERLNSLCFDVRAPSMPPRRAALVAACVRELAYNA